MNFRKWIEAGYRNYGVDPWFFIRELAQNSRDAGASAIHVRSVYTPGKEEIIVFEDDGSGMSYEHAVRYLFRLYASSKTHEKNAAGMFGIGFWTILKFNPSTIIIESRVKHEKWGVLVDPDLNTTRIPSDLTHTGTRITLIRTPREASKDDFSGKIREALDRYCLYLRRNNRNAEPLPIYFSGENIIREMKLPGPVSLNFKKKFVEGVVGLGPEPKVILYARGLPVWEGATLEELSHTPPGGDNQKEMEIVQGLAPVFLINGNRLEVNISRQRVIDNKNLQSLRKTAEDALMQMVERAADYVSPRNLLQWLSDTIKRGVSSILHSFTKALLVSLVIIIPLEIFLVTSIYKSRHEDGISAELSIRPEKNYYPGATVRAAVNGAPLNLVYTPPVPTWFKLFSADRYEVKSGFFQSLDETRNIPFPSIDRSRNALTIELKIAGKGKFFLPQAVQPSSPGLSIDPGSVRLDGVLPLSAAYSPGGEVIVTAPTKGTIRYACCLENTEMELSPDQYKRLTQLPQALRLPPSIETKLREFNAEENPVPLKVREVLRLTATILKYDDSKTTAEKYKRLDDQPDWFMKVTAIGAGDCDILNGTAALFLRKMGIPARLVIGYVGKEGKVLPGMHAWVEYFDNGCHIADATMIAPSLDKRAATAIPGPVRQPAHKWPLTRTYLVYALTGVLFILIIAAFVVASRIKKSANSGKPGYNSRRIQVQEGLAGMALHELLHPGAWGHDRGIRNFKLIPTITGRFVSLREALKLAGRRKLFSVNRNAPLARYLKETSFHSRRRYSILDAGNAAFAPLVKLLPGAIHLEKIMSLGAVEPGKYGDPRLAQLLDEVNKLLKSNHRKIPPLLVAPGLSTSDFFDVDLARLPSLKTWGLPNRFIAVNPNSPNIKNLAGLFQTNPQLAQYRFIHDVFTESNLIPEPSVHILERISRQLLMEVR